MPETLPGYSGCKMTGSKAEDGRVEEEVEDEEKEVMSAVLADDLVNSTTSGDLPGKVEETCGVEGSDEAMGRSKKWRLQRKEVEAERYKAHQIFVQAPAQVRKMEEDSRLVHEGAGRGCKQGSSRTRRK